MNCDSVTTWVKIRDKYETEETSFRKLEEEFGINYKKISRVAKKEKWVKYEKALAIRENAKVINPKNILDGVAQRKIEEIVKELGDYYSPVDEPLIVIYAKNYQRYLRLEAIVDEEGETVQSPKTGAYYMNPNFSALQSVTANVAKIGKELGLSVASRVRLSLTMGVEDKSKSLFDLVDELSDDGELDI